MIFEIKHPLGLNTSGSSGDENNQYNGQDLLAEKTLTECNSKRYQQP